MKRIVVVAASAALIVGGSTIALSRAAPTLSYQGVIDLGGEPLEGELLMRSVTRYPTDAHKETFRRGTV